MIKNLLLVACLFFVSCGGKSETPPYSVVPELLSSIPANGTKDWESNETGIKLIFNQQVTVKDAAKIKLNGKPVEKTVVSVNTLLIYAILQSGTSYELIVPKDIVINNQGISLKSDIIISFSTKESPVSNSELVVANSSIEAQKVFQFLKDNYGRKIISGTMANVSWNINEAQWVHSHTGKYPALNCFDYIHHPFSPSNWIDYSNTTVVENWWKSNGLVAAMWHWNVPANSGEKDKYSFYYGTKPEETLFDVSKISDTNSDEYKRVIEDIDKVSGYLKLLKDKNIPVIWRPLHEAAGNTNAYPGGTAWFWWGAKGADSFKKLWKLMFDRMTNYHKLTNLIWVWTSENNDPDWFPGNTYVDIIGRDLYNKKSAETLGEFNKLKEKYPNKIIALSECGNVPVINQQWTSGATWSWFMPWYDYERTNNPQEADFSETSHQHANINWWKEAFSSDIVITRDQMPSLK